MKRAAVVSVLLFALPCQAEEPQPAADQGRCYTVVATQQVTQPTILVDQCNGWTWMLIKTFLRDAKGKPAPDFTWRWRPISTDNSTEAVLGFSLPATPSPAGKKP